MKNLRLFIAGLALALVSVGSFALHTGTAAASVLEVAASQYCYGDKLDVEFAWYATTNEATTFVDLSQLDNNWRSGSYVSAGPFGVGTATYRWSGVEPGKWHFVRINQQLANGNWAPSATFSFFANGCGAYAVSVPPPVPTRVSPTINLVKCNDGTKSDINASWTCSADQGGISSKVTQPQVYTPYGGMIGNDVPVGQTGPYIPYNGAPVVTTAASPTFQVCANGTISTNCAGAGGAAASTTTSATSTASTGPALGAP